jgi:ABC-type transport system involved in multi-copper enzyme maturation permease subunit
MNFPAAFFIVRCLVRDTFRQAMAARTFWLMLCVSAVCIIFCLGVSVDGVRSLKPPGESELIGPNNKPLTGPNRPVGSMTLFFGAARVPLFRDAEGQVHFLLTLLAFWVAGTAGILAALIWTAGFIPDFLDPRTAAVLLAKPVPRWLLLLGKSLGVFLFVAFQGAVFFGGTWLALGLRTGVWSGVYLLCLPILLLQFAIAYSFSVLLSVLTRSTVAAVFGALLIWFVCYGVNLGRHAVVALPTLDPGLAPFPPAARWLAEAGYWLLPKPADLVMVLDSTLGAADHFDALPRFCRVVESQQAFAPVLSLLSSLVVSGLVLLIAARELSRAEY